MPCIPFINPDGSRGIACIRGGTRPPPCPFPADLGGEGPTLVPADPLAEGQPFTHPKHGFGYITRSNATHVEVQFRNGDVRTYSRAFCEAARSTMASVAGALRRIQSWDGSGREGTAP